MQNEGNLKEINFEGNVKEILEERRKFEGKSKISPKLVIFNIFNLDPRAFRGRGKDIISPPSKGPGIEVVIYFENKA